MPSDGAGGAIEILHT
jgi:hypothetical protein